VGLVSVATDFCSLHEPPADAGEFFNHGVKFLVYPRSFALGAGYSGCQSIWQQEANSVKLLMRGKFNRGRPVEVLLPDEGSAFVDCNSKSTEEKNVEVCSVIASFPFPSTDPGCVTSALSSGESPGVCLDR